MTNSDDIETTCALRAAARLTGLSPDLLRAWESRYGVVKPLRTAGGTRRYRASDVERLTLVKAAGIWQRVCCARCWVRRSLANTGAAVLALSLVTIPSGRARQTIAAIRDDLPDEIRLWIGGPGASEIEPSKGVEPIGTLEELERRVELLGFEKPIR